MGENNLCCCLSISLATIIVLAVPIAFTIIVGCFAFNNPDQAAWVGKVDNKYEIYATKEEADTANASDITDMHQRYVAWFLIAFIMAISPFVNFALITFGSCIHEGVGTCFIGLLGCAFFCAVPAFYIVGLLWRFDSIGRFASGDNFAPGAEVGDLYQVKSG